MIYTLFSHLFATGHFGLMLRTLTPSAPEEEAEEGIPRILVNNSQRTLLGLFDAYIHSGAEGYRIDGDVTGASSPDIEVLLASFTSLCIHLQSVVARLPDPSNPDDTSSEQLKVDGRTIIGVPQIIVIMVQCMVEWIMLSSKEIAEASDSNAHTAGRELLRKLQEQAKRGLDQHSRVANTEHMSSPSDEHIGLAQDPIGATVVLLRVIAAAFPAESPFKNTAPSQNGHSNNALPAGHVLSHTGTSSQNEQASRIASQLQAAGGPGKTAFSYLKRELVRLIGVVSFVEPRAGSIDEKEAVRHVQDYVRTLDGLLVVLSMTQLDEFNPYIREHAVFTLRNLLAGNQANQELIAQLRKVEE
ncbi:hypothetical protein OC845_003508 [Tilletia horrida]|nr:hypothetical protein OC845_003508 [Tilletia horrida]